AAGTQAPDVLGEAARAVEALADGGEALLGEALEADREDRGAGAGGQVEELGVAGDVDRRLADPPDAERDQAAEELLGLLGPRHRVVVQEEETAGADRAEAPDVLEDVVDRPRTIGAVIVALDRAVLARVRAAAREEDRPEEVHAVEPARAEGLGLQQRQRPGVDGGKVAEVVPALGAVDTARAAGLQVREDVGPHV